MIFHESSEVVLQHCPEKACYESPGREAWNVAAVTETLAYAGVSRQTAERIGINVDFTADVASALVSLRVPTGGATPIRSGQFLDAAEGSAWVSRTGDVSVSGLPGRAGVQVPRRLSTAEMQALTEANGVEFSLVYRAGAGSNGGGGQYWLHSGTRNRVTVPIGQDVRWISHTHPGGTPFASTPDQNVLRALEAVGSPQRTSTVIPVGGQPVQFNTATKAIGR